MKFSITETRSQELVTMDAVKKHLRVTSADEDEYISGLITTARGMTENLCRRHFVQKSAVFYMDKFPNPYCPDNVCLPDINMIDSDGFDIILKQGPAISIDAIKYYDADNTQQTLATSVYETDLIDVHARIALKSGQSWPDIYDRVNCVSIETKIGLAGTGASPSIDVTDNVPAEIVQAQYIMIGHLYENRMPVNIGANIQNLPFSYESLIGPYRFYGV